MFLAGEAEDRLHRNKLETHRPAPARWRDWRRGGGEMRPGAAGGGIFAQKGRGRGGLSRKNSESGAKNG